MKTPNDTLVRVGVVGTGQRARDFVRELRETPGVELSALCDVDEYRLRSFASEHVRHSPLLTTNIDDMLADGRMRGVIVTVPDRHHREIATRCFEAGKDVMLEKPMALTAEDCRAIIRAKQRSGRALQVGFVLRCTPFYGKLKELIAEGRFGQIMGIEASECLSIAHSASYMRRWHRKRANSGSFLLAKCSHDLDLLNWLTGSVPTHVASFGDNNYFLSSKQPATHCSKCPEEIASACRYRFDGRGYVYMPEAEKADPSRNNFDLCVYNDDKDIVDNQVCILQYANNLRATFSLQLFNPKGCPGRSIKVMGSEAYLMGGPGDRFLRLHYSASGREELIELSAQDGSGHDGGDRRFMQSFVDAIRSGTEPVADLRAGLASTVVGEALEKARSTMSVVAINPREYEI